MLDRFRLDGRVALVTGASRGLGRAMALALAEAGADVAALATRDCSETAESIRRLGRRAEVLAFDLASRSAPSAAVRETLERFGRLDILVNNAGIIRRAPFLEVTERDWDDVLAVNLTAAFLLSQAAARHMVERRSGKIIHVVSMLSFQGGIRVAPYTAAKSGLLGLTRIIANELAPLGIQCNAIAPGYMATDNTAPLRADERRNAEILARIPAGRWGVPEDLAGAVVFLASSASDYVNGAVLAVDGGWLAR
ncbi:MAG: 2-dehydro-3-deoxy-D-gluconate 5-dehydrogenase KduD [Kiritimatiellae bacterium]|nr:2-dehydro-3-deoxy-D-gluconate 5-dehydrogenase KduD [Kiritimatiellia bacterium]